MVREEPGLIGNARFEGYCVDLADQICKEYLNVDYEIRLVADGLYGERMSNGTWNGMVGELTNRVRIWPFPICIYPVSGMRQSPAKGGDNQARSQDCKFGGSFSVWGANIF